MTHDTTDWREQYPTTTHRGPQQFPVPGDWVLRVVEADGTMWALYEGVGDEASHTTDVDDGAYTDGPDKEAHLSIDFDFETETATYSFDIVDADRDPVFTVTEPDRNETMRCIAEVLDCVSRGERYHDVDLPAGDDEAHEAEEDEDDTTTSLGEFA